MQENIEEFLDFKNNTRQELRILYNYTILHTKFSAIALKTFYILQSDTIVSFDDQKLTISEILYNCDDFLEFIDDDLCSFIMCNTFISKNNLGFGHIISSEKLTDFFSKSDVVNVNFYIEPSEKVLRLVNLGILPPFISKISTEFIKLNRNTFKHLISENLDVSELMTYGDLDNCEIGLISDRILKDPIFEKACKTHIEEQGILNNTMQIIASLCNINKKSNISNRSYLHSKYCGEHFNEIYVPFAEFKAIGSITALESYLIYLSRKKNLNDDLNDISIALISEKFESLNTKKYCEKIDSKHGIDIDSSFYCSLSPLDNNFNYKPVEKSLSAQILDLVFKKNLRIKFDDFSFRNLAELSTESYFESVIVDYVREIVKSGLKIPKNEFLNNVASVLDFINQNNPDLYEEKVKKCKIEYFSNDQPTNHMDSLICSLDALGSSIFISSLDPMELCFKDNEECTKDQNTNLKVNEKDIAETDHKYNEASSKSNIESNKNSKINETKRLSSELTLKSYTESNKNLTANEFRVYETERLGNEPCLTSNIKGNKNSKVDEIRIPVADQEHKALPIKLNNERNITPFIDFSLHRWLTDQESNILMEEYLNLYDVDKISSNFLLMKKPSEKINRFFIDNANKIQSKTVRSKICCKFDISIDLSAYSDAEIKEILSNTENVFILRTFLMQKKIPKKFICKLFQNISDDKMQIIVKESLSGSTTDDFLIKMLETLCKMYEFRHIFDILISVVRLKRLGPTKYVQTYFIDLLKSMYVEDSYIPCFESLYAELLKYEDSVIKSNNDIILGLVAKCAAAMEKETFFGNIKQNK